MTRNSGIPKPKQTGLLPQKEAEKEMSKDLSMPVGTPSASRDVASEGGGIGDAKPTGLRGQGEATAKGRMKVKNYGRTVEPVFELVSSKNGVDDYDVSGAKAALDYDPGQLLSTINSPEIDARIQAVAAIRFPAAATRETFFEHGHWWLRVDMGSDDANMRALGDEDPQTFDVVDAEGGESLDGFDFEEIG